MLEFNYSIGDIRNSDLGEGIVCLGEESGGKGGGGGGGSGGKGRGKWGMPTPLSIPSTVMYKYLQL